MSVQTRLSQKMRTIAKQQPKRADRLNAHADRLDRAKYALGDALDVRTNQTYRQARTVYCEASGRAWDWGAADDLKWVARD